MIREYVRHKEIKPEESKDDPTMLVHRKVTIDGKDIRYIGKESNDLEWYVRLGLTKDSVPAYLNLDEHITGLNPEKEAEKIGISPRIIHYHQEMIRQGKKLKMQRKVRDAYLRYFI